MTKKKKTESKKPSKKTSSKKKVSSKSKTQEPKKLSAKEKAFIDKETIEYYDNKNGQTYSKISLEPELSLWGKLKKFMGF